MLAHGWNQSELARRAELNRDAVSTYVRGKVLPTPQSLKQLAEALGVKTEDLLPNRIESAIDNDMPAFEMRVSTGAPDRAWLRVNQLVTLQTAVKIAALLEAAAHAVDREGGSGAPALQHLESEAPAINGKAAVHPPGR